MTARSFAAFAQDQGVQNNRDVLADFFKRQPRGGVGGYEELLSLWDAGLHQALVERLKPLDNIQLMIYCDGINNMILKRDEDSRQKVWMNYCILENEVNRAIAERYLDEYLLPPQLALLCRLTQAIVPD